MNRIALAVSILAVAWSVTSGAQEPQVLTDLHDCMLQKDDARRLQCYDEMASAYPPVSAQPGRLPAPASVAAAPAMPAKAQQSETLVAAGAVGPNASAMDAEGSFGFRGDVARTELDRQQAAASRLERLTATVTKVAVLPRGQLVVTLDNGQVWRQKRADHARLKVGDQVTIRAGSLGSFWMRGPTGSASSVNRIQ